jgi:hypothetical protein
MTMSRLFLMVFVAGMLVIAPAASADVPNCDCLNDWDATWPVAAQNCLFVCPGQFGVDTGHGVGSLVDNKICLFSDENCSVGIVGFDAMRIDLTGVSADSICVCDDACGDYPYIYPSAATDGTGCTTFRFRGSILQLENSGADVAWLQVAGCQIEQPVRFRSPDVNADCVVSLADQVVFANVGNPPTGYQHYTVYSGRCAPPVGPLLGDQVIFALHLDHVCTHTVCDP